jgi:hypothetical protein
MTNIIPPLFQQQQPVVKRGDAAIEQQRVQHPVGPPPMPVAAPVSPRGAPRDALAALGGQACRAGLGRAGNRPRPLRRRRMYAGAPRAAAGALVGPPRPWQAR